MVTNGWSVWFTDGWYGVNLMVETGCLKQALKTIDR